MATDVEKLIVALEARTRAFENALARANGTADRRARSIERRFQTMNKNLSAGFNAAAGAAVRAFALIGGASGAKNLVDSATRIDNALKVAGLSGQELEKVYERLRASALANAAPIESLVTLYGRAAIVQKELGVSTEELLGFTNNVALALRVAGTDAQSASGALLQLSQALGSGTVRAEEFNSILEGALPIAQAAAAGLEEAGGSVAKLRQLVVDGEVSSEAFFRAFEAGSAVLEDKVANATLTLDQRLVNLQTSLVDAARRFNESAEASETFGAEIDRLSTFVNSVNFDSLISQLNYVISAMDQARQMTIGLYTEMGRFAGLDNIGKGIVGLLPGDETVKSYLGGGLTITSTAAITDRINDAFEGEIQKAGDLTAEAIKNSVLGKGPATTPKGGRVPAAPTVQPVSLADFAPPSSSKSGGGGGGRRRGGGGGRGGRGGADQYQREVEQIRERTAAIQAETAAMAQINPLIDDFGYSVDFARSKQDLLNAAHKAGVAITPEVEASINAMAEGYAKATSAAERLEQTQRQARETAEFFADAAYDAFSDLIPQIETGNKALDKFLNTLIEAVAQSVLLGKGPLGGGGGGLLGGLFKLFPFAEGGIAARGKPLKTFARGGISRKAAIFGEAGPEAAVPLPDGRRIPVDLRLPQKGGAGGSETINVNLQADRSVIAETADQRIQTASGTIVNVAVQQSTQRVVPTMAAYQNNKAGAEWR